MKHSKRIDSNIHVWFMNYDLKVDKFLWNVTCLIAHGFKPEQEPFNLITQLKTITFELRVLVKRT